MSSTAWKSRVKILAVLSIAQLCGSHRGLSDRWFGLAYWKAKREISEQRSMKERSGKRLSGQNGCALIINMRRTSTDRFIDGGCMSASRLKMDQQTSTPELTFCANRRHLPFSNNQRNVAHRDAGAPPQLTFRRLSTEVKGGASSAGQLLRKIREEL